jgi:hypothetical protein
MYTKNGLLQDPLTEEILYEYKNTWVDDLELNVESKTVTPSTIGGNYSYQVDLLQGRSIMYNPEGTYTTLFAPEVQRTLDCIEETRDTSTPGSCKYLTWLNFTDVRVKTPGVFQVSNLLFINY